MKPSDLYATTRYRAFPGFPFDILPPEFLDFGRQYRSHLDDDPRVETREIDEARDQRRGYHLSTIWFDGAPVATIGFNDNSGLTYVVTDRERYEQLVAYANEKFEERERGEPEFKKEGSFADPDAQSDEFAALVRGYLGETHAEKVLQTTTVETSSGWPAPR